MIDERELARLRRIEKLAWEAIKPASVEAHQTALAALHEALLNKDAFVQRDYRRGAVTLRIVETAK